MKIIRCTDGPFADHIAFVREGYTRVELYDIDFRSSPEPYHLELTADGEATLRWARGSAMQTMATAKGYGSERMERIGTDQAAELNIEAIQRSA
jgi:hypothetical protein